MLQVNSAELCQFTCDAFAECLLFRFSYGKYMLFKLM